MDSIYCRDASIATDMGMIICNMGKAARKNEPHAEKKAFEDNGIPVLGCITGPGTLEGGDVAWLDEKTLAVGHTYRTNEEGIRQLKLMLQPLGVEVIIVPLPHYKGPDDVFHLMSILSPVDKDLAVVYSPLMPISFRNLLLERGYRLVEVPDKEFENMACNVLALAPSECLMLDNNPKTKKALEEAGCKVLVYPGKEISIKGGGGPTCLTRPIARYI
jgi:N-dimethylarginine dimethylaminohydrolase